MENKSIKVTTSGYLSNEPVTVYESSNSITLRLSAVPTELSLTLPEDLSIFKVMRNLNKAISDDIENFLKVHPEHEKQLKDFIDSKQDNIYKTLESSEIHEQYKKEVAEVIEHFKDYVTSKVLELAADIDDNRELAVKQQEAEIKEMLKKAIEDPSVLIST